jgi:hypothetical protein
MYKQIYMNKLLFNFYSDDGLDVEGRTLKDMLDMSKLQLEKSHTVIQWMFPLNELSFYNHKAPILDDETIHAIKSSPKCMSNFYKVEHKFLDFLYEDGVRKPSWIKKENHNYLRITRLIKCCKLLGKLSSAEYYYNMAAELYYQFPVEIGEKTFKYWTDAYYGDI